MGALESASIGGEFYYHVQMTGFGPYVDQIGRNLAAGSSGWAFKVNGASPPVGADQVQLKDGDAVLWYWADFTEAGGPPTLELSAAGEGLLPGRCQERRRERRRCLRHAPGGFPARSDAGWRGVPRAAPELRASGRPGAVRSNALR